MPYKPTGRPPGRPKVVKPGAEVADRVLPEPPPAAVHPPTLTMIVPAAGREGWEHRALGELCAECWPDGWPGPTVTGLGCNHGVWVRRIS